MRGEGDDDEYMGGDDMNDGGPAFPINSAQLDESGAYTVLKPGMSLRDWFAGQALAVAQGMIQQDEEKCRLHTPPTDSTLAIYLCVCPVHCEWRTTTCSHPRHSPGPLLRVRYDPARRPQARPARHRY